MAQNFRINMKRWNGTDYDTLLPMNGGSNPVIGDIMLTTGNPPDDTWALCNGDEIDPVEYPVLAGKIKENFDNPVLIKGGLGYPQAAIASHLKDVVCLKNINYVADGKIRVSRNGGDTFNEVVISGRTDVTWIGLNYVNNRWVFVGSSTDTSSTPGRRKIVVAYSTDLTSFTIAMEHTFVLSIDNSIVNAYVGFANGNYFVSVRTYYSLTTTTYHDYMLYGTNLSALTVKELRQYESISDFCVAPDNSFIAMVGHLEGGTNYIISSNGSTPAETAITGTHSIQHIIVEGGTASAINGYVITKDDDGVFYANSIANSADDKAHGFVKFKTPAVAVVNQILGYWRMDNNITYFSYGSSIEKVQRIGGILATPSEAPISIGGVMNYAVVKADATHVGAYFAVNSKDEVYHIPKTIPCISQSNYYAYIKVEDN